MIYERIRGDKIRAAREKTGKRAAEVAAEIGVSLEYYNFLEFGLVDLPDKPVNTVSNKQMWDILNALGGGDPSLITDNTSSHSETEIYNGCISLMNELCDRFREFCLYNDIDISDRETAFCTFFRPTEIVKRLFLRKTMHSGGTSCRMKLEELGVSDEEIRFDVFEEG